jgi:hypothetical protein
MSTRASSTDTSQLLSSLMTSRVDSQLDLVVLANPSSPRLMGLNAALQRLGQPPLRVISYLDFLTRRVKLLDVLRSGSVLRVESPGQDFEVEPAILELGSKCSDPRLATWLSPSAIAKLPFEKGRLIGLRQWRKGFCHALERSMADRLTGPVHVAMNPEFWILRLFDTQECHRMIQSVGLPCTRVLEGVQSYDELRVRMNVLHNG